jgi:hypothetical protein
MRKRLAELEKEISPQSGRLWSQRLCWVLGIRRQGFYEWLAAEADRDGRAGRDEKLAVVITRRECPTICTSSRRRLA